FAGLDQTVTLAVSGHLTVTVSTSVYVTGAFSLAVTDTSVDVYAGATKTATAVSLLDLSITGAEIFAGVGGTAKGTTGVLTTVGATGLHVTGGSLELAAAKEKTGSLRSWTGLAASASTVEVLGITGVTVKVQDLKVLSNSAAADGTRVDWSKQNA